MRWPARDPDPYRHGSTSPASLAGTAPVSVQPPTASVPLRDRRPPLAQTGSYVVIVDQVAPTGNDTAAVQYQWRQGQEPACCPTGVATVRFKIEDGKLKALDPIPNA